MAIATLIKVKLEPEEKIAISSAGSGENVKLLREKHAQFALLLIVIVLNVRMHRRSL